MAYAAAAKFSWQEFNEWAREVMERTNKHPGVRTIRAWWLENAERVWPCPQTRPPVELAERHAKGLRSKESIRTYFRRYRAKRKQQVLKKKGRTKARACNAKGLGRAKDDEEDEKEDSRHIDASEDRYSDDEQREAAETLVTTLHNRPQRKRVAPTRFRSGSTTMSGEPDDSCGTGSLEDGTEDAEDSDAYPSPDGGTISNDKAHRTRSKSEPARRQERRLAGLTHCGRIVVGPDPLRSSMETELPERAVGCLGASSSRSQGDAALDEVPFQAYAEPGTPSEVDAHEGLLHYIATAGEHPVVLPLNAPPMGSVVLDSMGMPLLPQPVVLPYAWRTANMGVQDFTKAGVAGQLASAFMGPAMAGHPVFFQDMSVRKTPKSGAAKSQPAGRAAHRCTPSGSAAAARVHRSPYSQLRRMLSAPLISTQGMNMFGNDMPLNANILHGYSVQPDGDMGHVSNDSDAIGRRAKERQSNYSNDGETLPGRILSSLKRTVSDDRNLQCRKKVRVVDDAGAGEAQDVEGPEAALASFAPSSYQTPRQMVSCTPNRKAANPLSALRRSARTAGATGLGTDSVTPFQSGRKHQDDNSSSDDLGDLASADPSTVVRLGRLLGSDFGVSLYPELGLGPTPKAGENAEARNGSAAKVGTSKPAPGGSSTSGVGTGVPDGERSDDVLLDGSKRQPLNLQDPICDSAFVHMKQALKERGAEGLWVPVDETSGSMYGGAYDACDTAWPTLNAPPGVPYPHSMLPPTLGIQQMPLFYVPPAFPQHPGYVAGLSVGGDAWSMLPALPIETSFPHWQLLNSQGGLYMNAPLPGTYVGLDAQYWDAAYTVGTAAAAQTQRRAGGARTGW